MATMAAERFATKQLPDDEAWDAVERRDTRYDGRFVYAVLSTGIYCRPSCPSRRPARERVAFFRDPASAEEGGYRACRRCKPGLGDSRPAADAVARARAYLDREAPRIVQLTELAAHAGLSAHHLQRSFKRLLGVSPREYLSALRASHFKARLRAGDTVSRATYESGYGSSSRIYENSHKLLGMTPAAFRRGGKGMTIHYFIADSTAGRVLVGVTDRGVCSVSLGSSDAELIRTLHEDFPRAAIERGSGTSHEWVQAVLRRVEHPHEQQDGAIPLDVHGTAFQWQVWKALQEIPVGERRSYLEVATGLGRPTASRAVARACASNRVAVVIPCHRVVRETGEMGGYRWGIERKEQLLERERNDPGD